KQRLCLCHKNLTRANRSFLYDADYIAGSPQWFEKYPQDFPFSEQAPCENESRLNGYFEQDALFTQSKHTMQTASSKNRLHEMGTGRVRIPKMRTEPVRVAGYVRISAENHSHSTKQKPAISTLRKKAETLHCKYLSRSAPAHPQVIRSQRELSEVGTK